MESGTSDWIVLMIQHLCVFVIILCLFQWQKHQVLFTYFRYCCCGFTVDAGILTRVYCSYCKGIKNGYFADVSSAKMTWFDIKKGRWLVLNTCIILHAHTLSKCLFSSKIYVIQYKTSDWNMLIIQHSLHLL